MTPYFQINDFFSKLLAGLLPLEALTFYDAMNACETIATQPDPVGKVIGGSRNR